LPLNQWHHASSRLQLLRATRLFTLSGWQQGVKGVFWREFRGRLTQLGAERTDTSLRSPTSNTRSTALHCNRSVAILRRDGSGREPCPPSPNALGTARPYTSACLGLDSRPPLTPPPRRHARHGLHRPRHRRARVRNERRQLAGRAVFDWQDMAAPASCTRSVYGAPGQNGRAPRGITPSSLARKSHLLWRGTRERRPYHGHSA